MDSDRDRTAISLEVRRWVAASPERVFAAWTDPIELRKWWGPKDVRCISAEIHLRVGGHYRIGNELPDKTVIWIEGVFEEIEKPNLLVYTWHVDTRPQSPERVTVRLLSRDQGTEVIVRHERILTTRLRHQHRQGWIGCLDGLVEYLSGDTSHTT